MTLIVYVFSKLKTVKDLVKPMYKKRRFRTPFDSPHVKGSQSLVKSALQHFHHFFFITVRETDFKNVSLSDILNARTFSQRIDYQ